MLYINKFKIIKSKVLREFLYSTSSKIFCSDRLHSTDIAFKPSKSGWGYNDKYNSNFDSIFKKKVNYSPQDVLINKIINEIEKLLPESKIKLIKSLKDKNLL